MLATGLGRGGAETQLVRLARGLAARGWSARVGSMIDLNFFRDELEADGIGVYSLGMTKSRPDARGPVRMLRELRATRPTFVCSFLESANVVAAAAAKAARVPVVVNSIRSPIADRPAPAALVAATRPLRDAVVFNSQAIADDCVARHLTSRRESVLIRNGLDFEPFEAARTRREATRAALGLDDPRDGERPFVWMTVGNTRPEKNHDALIAAFERLLPRHPNMVLVLVGRVVCGFDERLGALQHLTETGRLRVLGMREDVPDLLAAADAFVLPSIYEASPNALLEAMASGLPVVATRVGGIPELVPTAAEGVLAPRSDVDTIEASLERVMAMTPADRAAMGASGRTHVTSSWGRERMIDEFEALFERLYAEKRAGRRRAT